MGFKPGEWEELDWGWRGEDLFEDGVAKFCGQIEESRGLRRCWSGLLGGHCVYWVETFEVKLDVLRKRMSGSFCCFED